MIKLNQKKIYPHKNKFDLYQQTVKYGVTCSVKYKGREVFQEIPVLVYIQTVLNILPNKNFGFISPPSLFKEICCKVRFVWYNVIFKLRRRL